MAKIILLCGKVCSGKSTYANEIKKKNDAVVLSCDDLMLALFDEQLGSEHERVLQKVKNYLFNLAEQIINTNTNVILDWGFWTFSERQETKQFFFNKGIETELHYIKVSQDRWLQLIKKRNESRNKDDGLNYYIDENMINILIDRFEEPGSEEITVLIDNSVTQFQI